MRELANRRTSTRRSSQVTWNERARFSMPALKDLLIWIESHPGTAAWVQAIGAIVALAIAIGVPVCMARRAERLNRRRFLESVASISGEVDKCFVTAAV